MSSSRVTVSGRELRELRRHNYKASVLPNKTASYLEHRRTRSGRGMNMGQKISSEYKQTNERVSFVYADVCVCCLPKCFSRFLCYCVFPPSRLPYKLCVEVSVCMYNVIHVCSPPNTHTNTNLLIVDKQWGRISFVLKTTRAQCLGFCTTFVGCDCVM